MECVFVNGVWQLARKEARGINGEELNENFGVEDDVDRPSTVGRRI